MLFFLILIYPPDELHEIWLKKSPTLSPSVKCRLSAIKSLLSSFLWYCWNVSFHVSCTVLIACSFLFPVWVFFARAKFSCFILRSCSCCLQKRFSPHLLVTLHQLECSVTFLLFHRYVFFNNGEVFKLLSELVHVYMDFSKYIRHQAVDEISHGL